MSIFDERLIKVRLLFLVLSASMLFQTAIPLRADPFGGLFSKKKSDTSGNAAYTVSTVPGLPPYSGPKKRMAVEPFEDKVTSASSATMVSNGMNMGPAVAPATSSTSITIQPPSDFGSGLTEMLMTELSKSNRFVLLERQNLADVTGEQKQDADPSFDQPSAPKSGALLGAQILIRGAITEYSYTSSGSSSQGLIGYKGLVGNVLGGALGGTSSANTAGAGYSTCKAALTIDLRIIDGSTGEIIDSVSSNGSSTSHSYNITDSAVNGGGVGTTSFDSSPLGAAVRQAVDGAVYQICTDQDLNAIPWECQVADLDSSSGAAIDTLYLDAGSNAGLKPGDLLSVMKPGRAIVSPETRLVIGRTKDKLLGRCQVQSVTPDLATATVVDGAGFAVGNVVQFTHAVPAAPSPTQSAGQ
jgi:curli biogenesis system outer membrane secretion channel CsgG